MKLKILNFCLILTSLFGFLEWGKGSQMFLFQAEYEIFTKIFTDPISVLHPFIQFPFIGQVLLFITLFQKQPSKLLTYIGLGCLSLLLLFVFFIGIISSNFKIICSIIPFIIIGILILIENRKRITIKT